MSTEPKAKGVDVLYLMDEKIQSLENLRLTAIAEGNEHLAAELEGGSIIDWFNARAAIAELIEALHEGRRAIGDHFAPYDCYATGPITGDAFRDLVQCPACSFIAMYDAAIAKATGATP